jgi:hypothetical protein
MQAGEIFIDFTILNELNPQLIKVQDNSTWFIAEDKQATIFITPPGSSIAITNIFSKNETNIFNSVNLELSCLAECAEQKYINLSDGIWTLCLKSAYEGFEKKRYHLKSDTFMIEWYKEWANIGLDYVDVNDKKYEALLDARKHLTSAESFTVQGDFTKASREFNEAQKKFNKIKKCTNCF